MLAKALPLLTVSVKSKSFDTLMPSYSLFPLLEVSLFLLGRNRNTVLSYGSLETWDQGLAEQ
jgi:hypothetical protein